MCSSPQQPTGCFSVMVELANDDDLILARAGIRPISSARRAVFRGIMDPMAPRLVLPEYVVHDLGLHLSNHLRVHFADGHCPDRPMATGVRLTCAGRVGVFNAVVDPRCDSALIGRIVLADLDLIADYATQTLEPRDPHHIITEA